MVCLTHKISDRLARALAEQLERRRTRGLLPDESTELRRLQRRVRTFRAIHAFEHAKPLHVKILEIQEATLGADHLDTMESLKETLHNYVSEAAPENVMY